MSTGYSYTSSVRTLPLLYLSRTPGLLITTGHPIGHPTFNTRGPPISNLYWDLTLKSVRTEKSVPKVAGESSTLERLLL